MVGRCQPPMIYPGGACAGLAMQLEGLKAFLLALLSLSATSRVVPLSQASLDP